MGQALFTGISPSIVLGLVMIYNYIYCKKHSIGMPLIGHVYPKSESVPADKRASWENIAYCVRGACELGFHECYFQVGYNHRISHCVPSVQRSADPQI